MFDQIHEFALVLTPVVIGFMQAIKKANFFAKDVLPIVSILVAILISLLFFGFNLLAVQVGFIAGLVSIGFYDVFKKSVFRK